MAYRATVEHFSLLGAAKRDTLSSDPTAFLTGAAMAGAYVGFGIVLIGALGAAVPPGAQKIVMASTFGIALTLVVFAGSELYTGHTMYMALAWLERKCSATEVLKVWLACWVGNLIGSVALAGLVAVGVGGEGAKVGGEVLESLASYKSQSPALHLFARGVACNWLICLALWMSARTTNDAAKCILIFWCLLGFIGLGLEHSVANMTLLSANLMLNGWTSEAFGGAAHNLFWVTLGNTTSGAILMGFGYWVASGAYRGRRERGTSVPETAPA